MAPAPKRVYQLPPGAIFTSFDDDFLAEVIYPCLTNQTLGRLSRAAKRFRNALLDCLEERMVEFLKHRLLLPSEKFKWRPLVDGLDDIRVYKSCTVPGRDFCSWTKDEGRYRSDRKGFALVEYLNSNTSGFGYPLHVTSVMDVTYYGFDCFKEGRWCQADPGRRDNFNGTDEEWQAEVAKSKESTFYQIQYSIKPSVHISTSSFVKDPGPSISGQSLSKALKIHEYVTLDEFGYPRMPKIIHERDPSFNHARPSGGSVFRLSSMKLPGIRQMQATSEVLVENGHRIWIEFDTEFGKVITSTYVSNDIGQCDDLKAILRRRLGADGPAVSAQNLSKSYLNNLGAVEMPLKRCSFTGLTVEPRPRPKPMPRVGNNSVWRTWL